MTGPLPSPHIEVLLDLPASFRMGLLGNIVACAWRGPITVEAVEQIGQVARSLQERAGPVRHTYLHLMSERVQLPDASVRNEIALLLPELVDHVSLIVVVLEGSGFWSSAIRGFLTGVRVLAPRTFDIRVESSIENVLTWFPAEHQKRSGVAISREQLEYLLHEVKSWQ